MKRLNKITLILVAVMGIVISGCGGDDINKAPFVVFEGNDGGYIKIVLSNNLDMPEKESEEIYKKLKVKKITLLGRKECPLQDKSEKSSDGLKVYMYQTKTIDCPPKDILKKTYEMTLKTNYGTFLYDTGKEKTSMRLWGSNAPLTYRPIDNNKGGAK